MASNSPPAHTFQKLKLVTSSPPAPSSFASIPRDDCDSAPSQPASTPTVAQKTTSSYYAPTGYAVPYDLAVGSSGSEDGFALGHPFRPRTTSISFDTHVRLDNGDTLALDVAVPKAKSRPSHPRTPDTGSYSSDHDYLEMPMHARRPLAHRVGISRYPLLQTTVDSLVLDPEYPGQGSSLTSDTTASPPFDEAKTPLEAPSEYALSPLAMTASLDFPGLSPRRTCHARTRSYRSDMAEDGNLKRASRRLSHRSGRSLSSMSPAASFLARYTPSAPIKPSEPDDEGQGIGYNSEYIIGKQIGYGGFSIVKEVTSMEQGKPVVHAVKIVHKQQHEKSELENEQIQTQFDHEVEIWRFLRHPYILPLLRVYTTNFATFCITKLNKGGTLFDLVRDARRNNKNGLPAHLAKRYAYQLASAMRYLHNDVQVVHRDIKLENCLVDMTVPNAETDGGDVLLCDFGMADFIVSDQRDGPDPHSVGTTNPNIGPADTSTSVAGSLQYAAPELFNAPGPVFSPAADIWAFGVVLFALITARLPFNEGMDIKTTEKIRQGKWDEEMVCNAQSVQESGGVEDALALLHGCLELDVEQRWTIHDILESAWLRDSKLRLEDVSQSWGEQN
ncbi:hypothetical protein ACEQ8H_006529 [Pleosporales sp. CAS-2024a]